MTNPTTPFSWQMPTATDLVTDLPADFEVFGQAVATSMGDLLGGSSGYILSKASATDMDFTWIANDQGDITGVTAGNGITVTSPTGPVPTVAIDTAITVDKTTAQTLTNKTLTTPIIASISNTGTLTLPTSTDTLVGRATTDTLTNKTLTSPALTTPTISTLTTNGDLLYGTGSGALARKAIGTTGQVLTVAAGIPSWATPATTGFIGCSVTKSAVQSIANNTSTTLTWDGELFDTSTFHDNTTNNSRITIPSGKDGYYQVTAFASPTGNATGAREITVCKNVGLTSLFDSSLAAVSASSIGFGVSGICSLVAGDYLQVQVYQNSGVSLNYNYQSYVTYFSVTYLGA